MKGLILAAGRGTRLMPLTDSYPKCMVEVNGLSIIGNAVMALQSAGIYDIFVVAGYLSDKVRSHLDGSGATIIENTEWENTNNMYSFYLTKHKIEDDVIMMNGDVFFDKGLLKELIDCEGRNLIASHYPERDEEAMKLVTDGDKRVLCMGKNIAETTSRRVSLDIYKMSKSALYALYESAEHFLETNNGRKMWTEVALDAIFERQKFYAADTEYAAVEIDDEVDLRRAEKIFKR